MARNTELYTYCIKLVQDRRTKTWGLMTTNGTWGRGEPRGAPSQAVGEKQRQAQKDLGQIPRGSRRSSAYTSPFRRLAYGGRPRVRNQCGKSEKKENGRWRRKLGLYWNANYVFTRRGKSQTAERKQGKGTERKEPFKKESHLNKHRSATASGGMKWGLANKEKATSITLGNELSSGRGTTS